MKVTTESVIVATDKQISARLENESVLLALKNDVYYSLDPLGTEIWEWIQEPVAVGILVDRITQRYEVDPQRCTSDLLLFLNDLSAEGLVDITYP